jgi:2,5-diamino-6-(ribosylamino)-4(3H)-pyrimidinone 5'-phosphate reductase
MLPRVLLHVAASLDGRTDWIDVDLGLHYGLAARWQPDCMLTGADTILADPGYAPEADGRDEAAGTSGETAAAEQPGSPEGVGPRGAGGQPETTSPDGAAVRPRLVVVDSRGRVHNWSSLRHVPFWREPTALCSRSTPAEYLRYLERRGVEAIVAGDARVDLRAALEQLADRFGVRRVEVDSGGALHGALLRAGLVDEVSLLVHPALVGGSSARWWYPAADLRGSEGAVPLRLTDVQKVGDGVVWLRYDVVAR